MLFKKLISKASQQMQMAVKKTPLEYNIRLSKKFNCNLYFKREDQQLIRSFKIRGAFNKINNLTENSKAKGIVCASAGNHAQAVAYTCQKLNLKSDIFIPCNTPSQKIKRIKYFKNTKSNIHLVGDSLDDCLIESIKFSDKHKKSFIHPYDDMDIIIGQGTIAKEIFDEIKPDIIIGSIGGGGLMSGIGSYSKSINSNCKLYGAEPETCASMKKSIEKNKRITISTTDNFVDGATVNLVGNKTFNICKNTLDDIYIAPIGKLCIDILDLYQNEGIIIETAGCLPVTVLDQIKNIQNKNIVCILSGGNNDYTRYTEIQDRLDHYLTCSTINNNPSLSL